VVLEKFMRDAVMFFVTIDPIGAVLLFTALTAGLSRAVRRQIAIKAIVYSAVILVASVVIGQILLTSLGISLASLKIAGGVILFLFGLQMIFGIIEAQSQSESSKAHEDIAVFPLAVPNIAGPGGIMAAILLTDNNVYVVTTQIYTTLVMLGVLALTFFSMLAATPILKVIGKNGAAILTRVLGMILVALSVEFVLEALSISGWGVE
jgi:multiple antibiotic resistance protein